MESIFKYMGKTSFNIKNPLSNIGKANTNGKNMDFFARLLQFPSKHKLSKQCATLSTKNQIYVNFHRHIDG